MAEVLLADGLARRGVDATVSSAGLLEDGRPASEHSVRVMADRGLDLSGHASRVMTPAMLDEADLIIAMERRHIREAAVLSRGCWPRAFTLRELERRLVAAGPRPSAVGLDEWLVEIAADRVPTDHLGQSSADDVDDPIGRSLRTYRKCAETLDGLVASVVDHLWPTVDQALNPESLRSTTA